MTNFLNSSYWTPLETVVKAALADEYDDIGVMKQRFNHWAMRGYRKLNFNLLRRIKRVMIPVDKNTFTAWMPADCLDYSFIGFINEDGKTIPLARNNNLVPGVLVDDRTPKCSCECSCNHTLCDAVKYELVEEMVNIGGTDYPKITKRFIREDGTYIEQITESFKNFTNDTIEEKTTSKDLCKLELTDCGCVKTTPENITALSVCGCRQAYRFCNQDDYLPVNSNYEGYFNFIEEDGLIQLNNDFSGNYLYAEYLADVPCVKGVVYVPAVALECIVNWIHFKRIQTKTNISDKQKVTAYNLYKKERSELRKNKMRFRIRELIASLTILPEY